MKNKPGSTLDRFIKYSFYALFLVTPWLMYEKTSELFELNKMWFVFFMSLLILFLWVSKMIVTKRFFIRRTPLDIPIVLFLVSQVISTIFSLDQYVSFWGYYSRFNGGLLSLLTYAFLYYAFASNVIKNKEEREENEHPASYKMLLVSLVSGLVVAAWGFPSHFGYDPTCFIFRGSFDVSCWTDAFQPKLRMFSTLGQPNWLAAYLAVLIPIAIGFAVVFLKHQRSTKIPWTKLIGKGTTLSLALTLLFYFDLVWTKSQSGFIGLWIGNAFFVIALLFIVFKQWQESNDATLKSIVINRSVLLALISVAVLLFTNFFIGFPIQRLSHLTYSELFSPHKTTQTSTTSQTPPSIEPLGGTDSGKIRLIVWSGALKIFEQHPLIGTGVETFAFAYYQVKPIAHNLTSEWDYLYNKAHNEYLNYLATTGILGLGTYLAMIALFFYTGLKTILKKGRNFSSYAPIALALIAGYISILISNFFGFSVVLINLFFFFIPLFFYDLEKDPPFAMKATPTQAEKQAGKTGPGQMIVITLVGIIIFVCMIILGRYWIADTNYALGNNLDKVSEYPQAYPYLLDAVKQRPNEPVFKDELSINLSTLALLLNSQKESTQAAFLASEAIQLSNDVTTNHPNDVVYFKSRTRVFYALSEIDQRYLQYAIDAINKAHQLAPTDAKVTYNMALLYQQTGDKQKTLDLLNQTINLKPDYEDAYYSIALNAVQDAKDIQKTDPQKAAEYNQEAKNALQFILTRLDPKNTKAKELLNSLQK